jgi:hypothetical protein
MRWTRQRWARDVMAGRIGRSVSDQRCGDERRWVRTAKSCGPDASTPVSSLAEAKSARPGGQSHIRWMTVTIKPDRRGEYEISR